MISDIGIVAIKDGRLYRYEPTHPYAKVHNGFVREDRLVIEAKLRRILHGHEVIQHNNKDLHDSRPSNVKLATEDTILVPELLLESEYVMVGKLGNRIDTITKIPRCFICGFPVDAGYHCHNHSPNNKTILRTFPDEPGIGNIIVDIVRGLSAKELLKKYPQYSPLEVEHMLWCRAQKRNWTGALIAECYILEPAPRHIYQDRKHHHEEISYTGRYI